MKRNKKIVLLMAGTFIGLIIILAGSFWHVAAATMY